MRHIFVFGSNLAGRHGAGAALEAKNSFNAEYGVGVGLTGNAYAIPTKDAKLRTLPLGMIATHIEIFKEFANKNTDMTFMVTRVGCGLAGYKDNDIAPLFKDSPPNCLLPPEWEEYNANS